jgi:hypothetical protein
MKMMAGKMAADDEIFKTSDAASADFAAELGSIDFATIIGGPLDACVKAQSMHQSTVNFINEVGFEQDANATAEKTENGGIQIQKIFLTLILILINL